MPAPLQIPLTRRRGMLAAAAMLTPPLAACTPDIDEQGLARSLRRPFGADPTDPDATMRELVRFATLAPSSHNTQCWTFHAQARSIVIAPDLARRCPVVDPDDHHLFVSLGCATENLVHAALAAGLHAECRFDPAGPGALRVSLDATRADATPLFHAITERQCTRGDYDGQPLAPGELRLLETAGAGNGVRMVLLTARAEIETVLEFVVAANSAQIADPAFVEELIAWIRFGADEAAATGDGLFSRTTGNPAVPRWLGQPMMKLLYTAKGENARCVRQIRNAAGLAVFVSEADDHAHQVEAGRCYERFALQATALGIRNAMLNQPLEVASIRPRLAAALGLGTGRPDLLVRFGRGPAMPMSMRRPVGAVQV